MSVRGSRSHARGGSEAMMPRKELGLVLGDNDEVDVVA